MDCIKIDLPREQNRIELHVIADTHHGDAFCDVRAVKQRLDYIAQNKNAYVLWNGDLVNWATKLHISDPYAERLTPMQQIQAIVDMVGPLAARTIAVTPGNHEFRAYKTEGIDIMRLACREVSIEDKYATTGALVFLRMGEMARGMKESNGSGKPRQASYVLYMLHGSGGGRKEGAKAIRLADMACIVDADIYIHSHTHLPMIMREGFYRTDPRNNTVAYVDKLFVNTGATLDYGGYGQAGEFKPASKRSPVITLRGDVKEYEASL